MDISVIVPVYNAQEFLCKCLDSIFSQVFEGTLEVITINDASTDNSLAILKEYQLRERRLIIIANEFNQKPAVSRANGMKIAQGNYIMHVDADDWLMPNSLNKLHQKSIESNADVVVYNYLIENSIGERKYINNISEELITKDKSNVLKYFMGNSATKFVKRNLTTKMITGEYTINSTAEDLLYCTEILLRAGSICIIPDTLYVYFQNEKSLTQKVRPETVIQNRVILLQVLRRIALANNAESRIINNILIRFERIIYSYSMKYWLSNSKAIIETGSLINSFRLFPEMSEKRIMAIYLSITKKRYSIYFTFKNYGLKYTLSSIIRSFFNQK